MATGESAVVGGGGRGASDVQAVQAPLETSQSRQDPEVGADVASAWPTAGSILLVVTDGARSRERLAPLVRSLTQRFGTGVIVAATRPPSALRDWFAAAGVSEHRLRYIDCVSVPSGLPTPADGRTLVLASASLLELIALRCEQWLDRLPPRRFLLIDSLSTLALHNGSAAVHELLEDLVVRLRRMGVPAAFVVAEGQAAGLLARMRPLVDGELRL
jgi:hypothetical protein